MKCYTNILVLLITLLFLVHQSYSQQNPLNWNFDEFVYDPNFNPCSYSPGVCVSNSMAPFQACGIQSSAWYASHGTPETYRFYEDNIDYAMIWSGRWDGGNDIYGEGLFLNCNTFEKGKTYSVKVKLLFCEGTTNYFKVSLVPNGQLQAIPYNFTVGNDYLIPSVSGDQVVFQLFNLTPNEDGEYSFIFTPDEDYTDLWIHTMSTVEQQAFTYIEYFYFEECGSSNPSVTFNGLLPSFTYASNNITIDDGSFTSGGYTEKKAGSFIDILPNSEVGYGSDFLAHISPCGSDDLMCGINDVFPRFEKATDRSIFSFDLEEELSDNFEPVAVFPNPVNDILNISIKNGINVDQVELVSTSGKIVFAEKITEKKKNFLKLRISEYPSGVYYLKLTYNSNRFFYEKIIVHH